MISSRSMADARTTDEPCTGLSIADRSVRSRRPSAGRRRSPDARRPGRGLPALTHAAPARRTRPYRAARSARAHTTARPAFAPTCASGEPEQYQSRSAPPSPQPRRSYSVIVVFRICSPSGRSTHSWVRRIGSCQHTSGFTSSGSMPLRSGHRVQRAADAALESGTVEEDAGTVVAAGAQRRLVVEVVLLDVTLLAETLLHELPVLGCEHLHRLVQLLQVLLVGEERAVRAAAVVGSVGDDALAGRGAEHAGPVREQPRHVRGDEVLVVVGIEEFDPFPSEVEGRTSGSASSCANALLYVLSQSPTVDPVPCRCATRGTRRRKQYRPSSRGGRPRGGHPTPMSSTKSTSAAGGEHGRPGRDHRQGARCGWSRRCATSPASRKTSGCGRADGVRHLGRARRDQFRRSARAGSTPRPGSTLQGSLRRRRGPADVPRRAPLVRLERGPHHESRHRRRLARADQRR